MDIKKWIKEHELFKFSSACKLVGLDAGNMNRKLNSELPFSENEETKLLPILLKYGYMSMKITGAFIPSKGFVTAEKWEDFENDKKDLSEKKSAPFPKEQKITLDVIRDRCPKELTGLDRSAWVREERQKYGV